MFIPNLVFEAVHRIPSETSTQELGVTVQLAGQQFATYMVFSNDLRYKHYCIFNYNGLIPESFWQEKPKPCCSNPKIISHTHSLRSDLYIGLECENCSVSTVEQFYDEDEPFCYKCRTSAIKDWNKWVSYLERCEYAGNLR